MMIGILIDIPRKSIDIIILNNKLWHVGWGFPHKTGLGTYGRCYEHREF